MSIQTVTSREFNQAPASVKRAALSSPVQITERGKVSHVLISLEKYQELTNSSDSIVDLLSMPTADQIEFEPQKLYSSSLKPMDFD